MMDKIKENQKIVIGAAVAIVVAIIIFCFMKGGKTLSCSTDKFYGMNIKSTVTIKFSGNDAKSMKVTLDLSKFGSSGKTYAKTMKSSLESQFKDKATVKLDGEKITISAKKSALSLFTGSNKESYKDVKKSIESLGYSCK